MGFSSALLLAGCYSLLYPDPQRYCREGGSWMRRIIEVVYEDGVFKPLEPVELEEGARVKIEMDDITSIVDASFGMLKGKDALKALKELEDEWGFC